jgi:hypothetical protein
MGRHAIDGSERRLWVDYGGLGEARRTSAHAPQPTFDRRAGNVGAGFDFFVNQRQATETISVLRRWGWTILTSALLVSERLTRRRSERAQLVSWYQCLNHFAAGSSPMPSHIRRSHREELVARSIAKGRR